MRIDTLEAFGIDDRIIELWKEAGAPPIHRSPSERKVLTEERRFSPTSSGRPSWGRWRQSRLPAEPGQSISSQKALAEE
jgi:hypothetical protein